MDITALLIDHLNKKYGKEALNVLSENALYYIIGDKYITFDKTDIFTLNRRKAIMMLNQNILLKICDLFHSNNIDYISFKGVILSNLLYKNSFSRNAGDIDIFVSESNFERAYQLLSETGYTLKDENDYANQHHIVLQNNMSIVELHRNMYHPSINIDETYLRNNLDITHIANKPVYTFNITATLLHLIYHLYMDVCLEGGIMFDFYTKKQFPKVGRFLYRVYEIALFSAKYYNIINWDDIRNDFLRQKLRVSFEKMILDIIEIFPNIFPESVLKTVFRLHYNDDGRDQLFQYLVELKLKHNDEDIDTILSNYIEEKWLQRREKNISKDVGESISLIKKSKKEAEKDLKCIIDIEKKPEGLRMTFQVSNDDFCISETDNYNTLTSDGIHLLLCGTVEYSYNSIFFFPKEIDGLIKVIVCDVLNDRNTVINDNLISADFLKTEDSYTITALLSNEFVEDNHLDSYFYMGLIVSDCSNKTQSRKNELVLSEEDSLWYDPTYFAKIMINNQSA